MKQARVIGLATGSLVFDEHGKRTKGRDTLGNIIKRNYLKNGYHQINILLDLVSTGGKGSKDYHTPLELVKDYHKRVNSRKKGEK